VAAVTAHLLSAAAAALVAAAVAALALVTACTVRARMRKGGGDE